MNESTELKLRLGFGTLFGLAFLAAIHALTLSVSLQHRPGSDFQIVDLPPLLNPTSVPEPTFYSSSPDLPQVNLTAQGEMKNAEVANAADGTWNVPATMAPYQPPNQAAKQQIGQIGPMQGSVQADCPNCPQPQPYYPAPRPPNTPAPTPAPYRPSPMAAAKEYQLLLFIGNDDQSREILNWFNQHPKYQFLRSKDSKVAVQVYSSGDAMYRARYASVVPVSEFPAIVLADAQGGHIHAASRQFIPRGNPDKLYDDLQLGTKLYLQAKQQRPAQAVTSGAMTSARQYTWDQNVSPNMRLESLESQQPIIEEGWRPRQPDNGGGLFDSLCGPDGCNPKNAFVWANANEILMAGLVVIAIIAAVQLIKKTRG
jgi:hypothetical protein